MQIELLIFIVDLLLPPIKCPTELHITIEFFTRLNVAQMFYLKIFLYLLKSMYTN